MREIQDRIQGAIDACEPLQTRGKHGSNVFQDEQPKTTGMRQWIAPEAYGQDRVMEPAGYEKQ